MRDTEAWTVFKNRIRKKRGKSEEKATGGAFSNGVDTEKLAVYNREC